MIEDKQDFCLFFVRAAYAVLILDVRRMRLFSLSVLRRLFSNSDYSYQLKCLM